MKRIKTLLAICFSAVLLVGCAGCKNSSFLLQELKKITPEVDYGYMTFGDSNITQDGEVYQFVDMIEQSHNKKCEYLYNNKIIGSSVYVFGQYDRHGKIDYSEETSQNHYTFDVALFRIDVETRHVEEIYDFKNVYPTNNYDYLEPPVGRIFDENRALIEYNGSIQILDLQQKKITHSIEVYDKEEFRTAEFFPYQYNEYGDYRMVVEDKLFYYELTSDRFTLHEYEVNPQSFYVTRWENYVYTHYTGNHYYDCFNLTTNERVDVEEVLALQEASQPPQESQPIEPTYVLQGKTYTIESEENCLNITSEGQTVKIDEAFMLENSQKFVELYDFCSKNHQGYELSGWTIVNDKLFVGFHAHYGLWHHSTPTYLFEYNPQTNAVYYVGFTLSGIHTLRIYEK